MTQKAAQADTEPKYQCCFCGHTIESGAGLRLEIPHPDGSSQGLASHITCFEERLHPSVPFMKPETEATPTV
jgi:hypothetical protein